jgi:DNA polymerase-1
MKKVVLVDGYGLVFRAFHSLPPLRRPSDQAPVGAVYGFTKMLLKLVQQHDFSHIAVVFDSGAPNFRHELYSAYKANRPEVDADLIAQFPMMREVVRAFGIKGIEHDGFEADDMIATYAYMARNQGFEVEVVSSDKDLMQLVQDGISLYDPVKDKKIGYQEVVEKFGVSPLQVRDVLALTGDSADNVPGVKGIGPKTAAELLQSFVTLNGVYEHLHDIKQEKRRQMLQECKEMAFLSYELVGLKKDAPMTYSLDELFFENVNSEMVASFARKFGFKSIVQQFAKDMEVSIPSAHPASFRVLNNAQELASALELYSKTPPYMIGLLLHEGVLSLSFASTDLKIAINCLVGGVAQPSLLEEESFQTQWLEVLEILKPLLVSRAVVKVTMDAKAFYKLAPFTQLLEDVGIMSYTLHAGKQQNNLLDVAQFCGVDGMEQNSRIVIKVYESLKQEIIAQRLATLYERVDRQMPRVLFNMQNNGVGLDVLYLNALSRGFEAKLQAIESEIFAFAGYELNLGSPKQVAELLFEVLSLPKTKKGDSTDAETLEELAAQGHSIATLLLNWRQYSKLISTYTKALPKSIDARTGRVHSTFSATSTITGRLTSNNPNLQNIPIRTEEGSKIRNAFIAGKGNLIVSADYSQIELRLLAHCAEIPALIQAFARNQDIHALTASTLFDVDLSQVTEQMRRQAKTVNFSIIYGISPYGLARRLEIPQLQAKRYIEEYFKQYPEIHSYMQRTLEFARTHGYVKTIFGRKCPADGINDRNFARRSFAERSAINAPLQGSAADIIKKAMSLLDPDIQQFMVLQIHDELLFEIPESLCRSVIVRIKATMESVAKLSVPLVANVAYGESWGAAH